MNIQRICLFFPVKTFSKTLLLLIKFNIVYSFIQNIEFYKYQIEIPTNIDTL